MIKNKQISLEVTRVSDCFTAVICIMYLYWNVFQYQIQKQDIKWRLQLDNNKKQQNKQKAKNKHSLKDCIEQFLNFSYKNIILYIIL